MSNLNKYTWLIDTLQRAGSLTLKEISERWKNRVDLSDGMSLSRSTFNHWINAIYRDFQISIKVIPGSGYRYGIENPEDIEDDKLKKWMLDSMAMGNMLSENLSLKDRILVQEIPSGREFLTTILQAMKENKKVEITYHSFNYANPSTFAISPYCVKLFESRWYVLARTDRYEEPRLYGIDRFVDAKIMDEEFQLPENFCSEDYFAPYYGVVLDKKVEPRRIVLRAYDSHISYMKSLPMHHTQQLLEENDNYADFELYLAPTYDFIMGLLRAGAWIEVKYPPLLRKMVKGWIDEVYEIYQND